MRKHLRAIARHHMKEAGIERMNRKNRRGVSYFAAKWRKYITMKPGKRKRLRTA